MKISEIVREMVPTRYTTSQAAALVGRSVDTLRRWREDGVFEPSDHRDFGHTRVWLYTREDIDNMRKIARSMKTGPKSE